MRDIEIRDILLLARSNMEDAGGELKQLYQWRHEYVATAAKAILAAGASLVAVFITAAIQPEAKDSWQALVIGSVGAIVVLSYGWFAYRRIRLIYREYATARDLLGEAIKVRDFLRLYGGEL